MSREAHIPLVLWISTATLVHAFGGSGAVEVARTISDRASVRSMVQELRLDLAPDQGTIEVVTDAAQLTPRSEPNPAENPNAKPLDPPKDPPKPDEAKPPPKPPPKPLVLKPPPPPPKAKPPDPPKPKPEPPKVAKKAPPPPLLPLKDPPKKLEEKKKAPPPPEVAKKEEPEKKAPPPPPPPPPDRRIAVVQDVPKDQEDNPNAKRIAPDANTVKDETVARVRAFDGTASAKLDGGRAGTDAEKGNSDENKSGHNEEKAGVKDHAPGESAKAVASVHSNPAPPAPPSPAAPANKVGPPLSVPGNTGGGGKQVALTPPANQPPAAVSPGGAGPASPEVKTAAAGGWSLDPANPGGDGSSRVAGPKREAVYQSPVRVQSVGFGAPGLPGGLNINLTMAGLETAVGQDKLKQERAADGEARRAKHRGANGEKEKLDWRAAVENYEPSVKLGNQTSLNAAKNAFAGYLNTMHNRIHPIFAEEFLQSLSNLPTGHKFNDNLVTFVELVLNKDDGKILRAGITKASGFTAFDVIAVNSARRAGPFGKPPDAIVSPDGKVYIHWEFHRDPYDACSSRNARPYLLKAEEKKDDKPAEQPKPPEAPKPAEQREEPPSTHGPVAPPRE
jgi:hypothetical protein